MTYFHDLSEAADTMKPGEIITKETAKFVEPKIEPNDILSISITTEAQNESNAPIAGTANSSSTQIDGFLVDKNGYIEYVLLGFVKVAGLTTTEARELIKQKAKEFYKNPIVNVRIVNFDVTVLGDVQRPGRVTIPSEKATILDVISMSGDLQLTAKRKNILLARTEGEETKFVRLDVTSSDIFKSPYFYVKQRDIIYVEQNTYKNQTSDNTVLRYFGFTGAIVAIVSLLFATRIIK